MNKILRLFNKLTKTPPRIAIAGIFKNEGPYILEWVAHHRLLGFHDIIIADNASTDESTPILRALDKAKIITHVPFPGTPGKFPQLPAYQKIFKDHCKSSDWVAVIDADEFIMPDETLTNIDSWLNELPTDVGAVAINWLVYGSSHQKTGGEGLVQERFVMRAKKTRPIGIFYKSIVRKTAYKTTKNPHHFILKNGYHYADSNGHPLEISETFGKSRRPVFGRMHLKHFIIKSKAEFIHKKMSRGRATWSKRDLDMDFFTSVDINDVSEYPNPARIAALKNEVGHLKTLIANDIEKIS